MRGTRIVCVDLIRCRGIIPAYAGNTHPCRKHPKRRRDHPRVCGEHLKDTERYTLERGSSPRMRGTLRGDEHHDHVDGIIPAYAGNTYGIDQALLLDIGSSPRMRGTPARQADTALGDGIIPAYAGNTRV